jgi:small subunit ribosomal protein S6
MSKGQNHLYEGMYVFNATLSEEARQKALDKITNSIVTRKGQVCKIFDQGRRRFAYKIKERGEGYYYIVYFEAPPLEIKEMHKEYLLNEDLLRFMTLRSAKVPEKLEFKTIMQQ